MTRSTNAYVSQMDETDDSDEYQYHHLVHDPSNERRMLRKQDRELLEKRRRKSNKNKEQ